MRVPGTGSAPRFCSGKRKRNPSSLRRSLEYLCVSRLRSRRLLAFLSRHGFNSTFEALVQETNVFFSVAHLQRLMRLGQWGEAIAYVSRFVRNVNLLGEEGSLLFSFLSLHKVIYSIATRTPDGAVYERELMEHPNPDLQKKRSLLSLSRCEGISLVSGLSCRATALLAKFIDISVGAGMNRVVQDEHPFEDSCNKAIPKCKQESSASCNLNMMEVSFSAKRKQVRRPLEYPCMSRLRHRRLLAFLRWRSSDSTFKAFVHETNVFFSIEHLQRLVFLGQWDDSINYFSRSVPSLHMLGSEGIVCFNFLEMHQALHSIAAGEPNGALLAEHYERNLKKYPNSDPGIVKLTRVLLTMLRWKHLRASIDWSCLRFKAAEIVKDLITKTPEFNDLLRLPNCRDKPHNILPIGSCSHQRHHMKKRGRIPASDIAKFYLQKKRSLPSSSHCEGDSVVSGLLREESKWLADIIVECVQAGIRRVVLQGHSFEDSCNEGLKHTVITGNSGLHKYHQIPGHRR